MEDRKKDAKSKSYYPRLPAQLHQALVKRAEENRRSLVQEIIFSLDTTWGAFINLQLLNLQ